MSTDNTLFAQGVPEGVTSAQLQTAVNGAAKEVTKVTMNERKRFVHIVFESHEAAEKGLKALKKASIGGQNLEFEWSKPKEAAAVIEFDEANNKTIYIRNLTATDDEEVKTIFSAYGEIERAFLVHDKRTKIAKGQAIVEFTTRASAEKALKLNDTEVNGQTISVEFAKAPRAKIGKKTGNSHTNGGASKKPAQKRKADADDEEEKPAKKAKATETAPKKEAPKETAAATKKETPKKESAAAAPKKETPKKEAAATPKKETPKKAATPSKAKGKK